MAELPSGNIPVPVMSQSWVLGQPGRILLNGTLDISSQNQYGGQFDYASCIPQVDGVAVGTGVTGWIGSVLMISLADAQSGVPFAVTGLSDPLAAGTHTISLVCAVTIGSDSAHANNVTLTAIETN